MAETTPTSPGSMINFLNEHPGLAGVSSGEAYAAYGASMGEYQTALSEFYGISKTDLHDKGMVLGRVILANTGEPAA